MAAAESHSRKGFELNGAANLPDESVGNLTVDNTFTSSPPTLIPAVNLSFPVAEPSEQSAEQSSHDPTPRPIKQGFTTQLQETIETIRRNW